jgi:PBP1b-binding outer membrane lipoprotein LpoB
MKQIFFHISLFLALLLAGCTEVEVESEMNSNKNPTSQSSTEKNKSKKITAEANDPVKKQHLSRADSSISEENSEPKPHV